MAYVIEVSHSIGSTGTRYNIRRATDGRVFERHYLWHEAMEVLDWMNDKDRPLTTMVSRHADPRDPQRVAR